MRALGQRHHGVDERVEVGDGQRRRKHQREQGRTRRGAHGGEVAQVDGERLVADVAGAAERAIEVHAFDERVGRDHVERIALRLHNRRIVPDADDDPAWGRRDSRAYSVDERALADGFNGLDYRRSTLDHRLRTISRIRLRAFPVSPSP